MARYAAFLRGINLGNRRVTGDELCAPFTELGFHDVASFLASGNVVFRTDGDDDRAALTTRIGSHLQVSLGYPVLTFLRTDTEVAAIAAHEPFTAAELDASAGKRQVILVADDPSVEVAQAVLAHASDDDRLAWQGQALHWLPAGNMSASELDLDAIAKLVGPTTIRTANTIVRLHAKYLTHA